MKKSLTFIAKGLLRVLFAYCILVFLMFLIQSKLLFHPSPIIGKPADYGLKDFDQITLTTEDNLKLSAWIHKSTTNGKALVYFYGNADSLQGYQDFFRKLADHGYTVLGVNYRGYGGSEGTPDEQGLYKDARAAINYLKQITPTTNIIVVGRSLGTGVAVEMAKEFDLNSIVLISPYTSIPDVAARLYPYLPVHFISRYDFNSLEKISTINEPVLIIHGDVDRLIPIQNGHMLFDAVKTRKALNIYKGGDHILLDKGRIADDIFKFVDTDNNANK